MSAESHHTATRFEIDPSDAMSTFLANALVSSIAVLILCLVSELGLLPSFALAIVAAIVFPYIMSLLTKPYRCVALEITKPELVVERKKEQLAYPWASMKKVVRHTQKNQPYLILHTNKDGKTAKRMFNLEGIEPELQDQLFAEIESRSGRTVETVKK